MPEKSSLYICHQHVVVTFFTMVITLDFFAFGEFFARRLIDDYRLILLSAGRNELACVKPSVILSLKFWIF